MINFAIGLYNYADFDPLFERIEQLRATMRGVSIYLYDNNPEHPLEILEHPRLNFACPDKRGQLNRAQVINELMRLCALNQDNPLIDHALIMDARHVMDVNQEELGQIIYRNAEVEVFFGGQSFSSFLIKKGAIERLGLLDDKFPSFTLEMDDYIFRMKMNVIRIHRLGRLEGLFQIPYSGQEHAEMKSQAMERYLEKWGGPPNGERFREPQM